MVLARCLVIWLVGWLAGCQGSWLSDWLPGILVVIRNTHGDGWFGTEVGEAKTKTRKGEGGMGKKDIPLIRRNELFVHVSP